MIHLVSQFLKFNKHYFNLLCTWVLCKIILTYMNKYTSLELASNNTSTKIVLKFYTSLNLCWVYIGTSTLNIIFYLNFVHIIVSHPIFVNLGERYHHYVEKTYNIMGGLSFSPFLLLHSTKYLVKVNPKIFADLMKSNRRNELKIQSFYSTRSFSTMLCPNDKGIITIEVIHVCTKLTSYTLSNLI